jgi:alpha-tubulin suppressor-like RCC1 family protein
MTAAQTPTSASSGYRISVLLALAFLFAALSPFTALATAPGRVIAWGAGEPGASGHPHYGQSIVPAAASDEVIAIAAGAVSSLALKSNGTVVAWGHNDVGQLTVPAGLGPVVAIASSTDSSHFLALKANGTLAAWGYNTLGQVTGSPSSGIATANPVAPGGQTITDVVAIAAGSHHNLALKYNGTVVAWGTNQFGSTVVPSGLNNVVAVAAGYDHCLALKADGTVVAWGGLNTYGEITVPAGLGGVVAISAAGDHSVALKSDGTVVAWGNNFHGQTDVPAGLSDVVAISAGNGHVLALKNNGTLVTWGNDSDGQTLVLPPAQSCVLAISAGGRHSLALVVAPPVVLTPPATQVRLAGQTASFHASVAGTPPFVYQWIKDGVALVDGGPVVGAQTAHLTVSNLTPADSGVYALEAGNCAGDDTGASTVLTVNPVAPPGEVIAWGDNSFGQCAVPSAAQSGVVAISAGQGHTLALKSNGQLLAWGWNTSGQTTIPLATLNGSVAISAGQGHSVALRNDGIVLAWGNNAEGQASVPAGLSGVVAIAAGGSHTVALKHDGTVVAWGHDGFGQRTIPPGLSGVVAISAGMYHTVALKDDGTLVTWGDNTHGQCAVPAGLSGVIAIAAGYFHTEALLADGSVVAFGAGATNTGVAPQLGQSLVPAGLANGRSLAAGRHHGAALLNDKTIVAWGDDSASQSTVPATMQGRSVAVAAGWMHTVAIAGQSPVLNVDPLSAYVNFGRDLTFSVVADGTPPFTYQWRRQSAMGSMDIAGATGPVLRLANVQLSQSGSYLVVVSNAFGSATASATLTVLPATSFTQWRESRFTAEQLTDPSISGPLADPSARGTSNLLKYAFNLEPVSSAGGPGSPSVTPPSSWPLQPTVKAGAISLVFHAIRPDLVYSVEASADLVTWTTAGVAVEADGTAHIATFSTANIGRAFLRVRVSLPAE